MQTPGTSLSCLRPQEQLRGSATGSAPEGSGRLVVAWPPGRAPATGAFSPPSPPGRGCVFLHPLEPQGNPAHSHGSPGPEVTAALRVLGRDAGHLAGLHPLPCPEGAQDTLLSSLGPRTACPPATIASIDHVPLMKPGPWFCWRHGVSVNTGRTGQLYFTSEFLTFSKCFTLIS